MTKNKDVINPWVPILLLLFVWQVCSWAGFLNSQFLPSPLALMSEIVDSFANQHLLGDIFASLKRVLIGFTIAAATGVSLGIFAGTNQVARSFISPLAEIFRPIPPIAWIPIAILWFGLGDKPAFFLVFLGAFFPIFTNSMLGALSLEETHRRAAYSLGADKKHFLADILLPASLPHIFAGMKIGLGVSWMAVITAELVGSQSGLGYMIQFNRFLLNTPKVVVGMVVIGAIGFLLNRLMARVEAALVPWKDFKGANHI
ncbi:MAG: ABC transporter permease [Candidatus Pacebacteria bacterium]|jgi:ABC-type nitrate/sulfonate/bicarbonate transport system permease component|nr:ABC transporter permease [Candidatus Paceibacterota bacterium]